MHFFVLLFIKIFYYKERVISLKIFTVNLVSMHFSATWHSQPFQCHGLAYSEGTYELSCSGGGLAQIWWHEQDLPKVLTGKEDILLVFVKLI